MKHRHRGHDSVPRRNPHHVRRRRRPGMQHGRAVRIQHALRVAGRAGTVTHGRGGPFVELRPVVIAVLYGQQGFVAIDIGQRGFRHIRLVRHDDEALHGTDIGRDLFEQRQEGQVGEDQHVFGMVHDIGDLRREKPGVDHVTDRAHARYAVIQLVMAIAVPRQGRDPVAFPDSKRPERFRKFPGADFGIRKGITVDRPLDGPGHDFSAAMILRRMFEQR